MAAENRFRCLLGVNPDFSSSRIPALECLRLPPVAGETINLTNAFRARRVAGAVGRWLRGDERRIFHGHSRAGLLVALWLRAAGERRVAATVHCYGRQRGFYHWAARRLAGRIWWLTPGMKRYYGVSGADSWEDCVPACIPPGVAPARAGGRPPGGVRFGCVGALVPFKEWELVLRALAEIPRAVPLRVVHAGCEDGSPESARYAAWLRQVASELGVADRIEWRGEVNAMAAFYAELDCLVIAAQREGCSVAALEAGAAGVPVLAADVMGNRDLLAAARLGWLFPAGSAGALAERMIALATTAELAGWQRDEAALRPFTAPAVAGKLVELYGRLRQGN